MFAIIGIVIVLGAVIGGYLMEHGNLSVLFQPAELVIIGGAALGSFVIAAPKRILSGSFKGLLHIFTAKGVDKGFFQALLMLLYDLLTIIRKEGLIALEPHVNKPEASPIFQKHGTVAKDHAVRDFLCDNIKSYMAASIEAHQYDELMSIDIESQHEAHLAPPAALNKVADSLPGLGIVAAVLGVVLTMGKISEPPEVLGHSIGAALVGTFLGILACYGFLGPLASNLEYQAHEHTIKLNVLKAALMAFAQGWPPALAVEAARRAIPSEVRPSFDELEEAMRGARKQ
jgi:chemotaxis protein MotA